ncbi:hypothetical protein A5699_23845 [Mycobacterium sp. E802]|uniref:Rv1733c family protein n=1 Tax=Mycobacterium sp. E802 TaxID=1834152 RepID=UPI0008003672|nr:hypothetical protein [Mycobacterium sp. E802]OBG85625.1 hypothetical protein A5699_23845 [Mycobacterium sp. E802]
MRVNRRRWWVLRALGRNPLVRRSDRFEAWAMVLVAIFVVLVIPHAVTVGENVYAHTLRTAEIQAQTRKPVQATVVDDTPATAMPDEGTTATATVTWTANGTPHTGAVRPTRSLKAGDTVPIWVDENGRRVSAPLSPSSAGTYAIAAAVSVWLGTAVLCGLAIAGLRALLDRLRIRTWAAELRVLLDRGDGRTRWHH